MCKVCAEAVHSVALCPAKKAQTPKHGPGKKDRNRATVCFRVGERPGLRVTLFTGFYTSQVGVCPSTASLWEFLELVWHEKEKIDFNHLFVKAVFLFNRFL